MKQIINEYGKKVWVGVTENTPFDLNMFHEVDMNYGDDWQVAMHTELGSITVVDRMTGFGWRDTETGFRDKANNFWLAQGNCDVRESGVETIGEAIEWIKNNANGVLGK